MSELLPEEERLTKLSTSSGDFNVYPSMVTIFTYKDTEADHNSVYDHMYISHPENENPMYWWRVQPTTGEINSEFEPVKQRAIELGALALLNLRSDYKTLQSDIDMYIKHGTTDLGNTPPEWED